MEAAELPLWLQVLEPLSVPFVILLMLAGSWIEVRRDRERRRRYDARLRARTYALATILDEWIDHWPNWGRPGQTEDEVSLEQIRRSMKKIYEDCSGALDVLEDMQEIAPETSNELAEMAREVYARLLQPIQRITMTVENVSGPEPHEFRTHLTPVAMAAFYPEVVKAFNQLRTHIPEYRKHTIW